MIAIAWLGQEPAAWLKDLGSFSPSRLFALSAALIVLVVTTKYIRRWVVRKPRCCR